MYINVGYLFILFFIEHVQFNKIGISTTQTQYTLREQSLFYNRSHISINIQS
jgi:hypothetical protein